MNDSSVETGKVLTICFISFVVGCVRIHYGNFTDTFFAIGVFIACIAIGFVLLVILTVSGSAFNKSNEGLSFVERIEEKLTNLERSVGNVSTELSQCRQSQRLVEKSVSELSAVISKVSGLDAKAEAIKAFERTPKA